MIHLLLKSIKPATRIGVSNLKYEIDKATLSKFGINVKYLISNIFYNYTIIIDKGEFHKGYVSHIFRDILSGTNSTFNSFIEIIKYDCYTGK